MFSVDGQTKMAYFDKQIGVGYWKMMTGVTKETKRGWEFCSRMYELVCIRCTVGEIMF